MTCTEHISMRHHPKSGRGYRERLLQYEAAKSQLLLKDLTPSEYESTIRKIAKKLKI